MYFDVAKTQGALGAVIQAPSQGHSQSQSQHLNPQQFPKAPGAEEATAAPEAAAGAGEAAAGGELAELAPLALAL